MSTDKMLVPLNYQHLLLLIGLLLIDILKCKRNAPCLNQ
ncbi:hypothetical protein SPWS13_4603 [Shewanella putrefaciens]|nr:hypothetical protein SPWS13_4603 [Shewanella putrefaciens]